TESGTIPNGTAPSDGNGAVEIGFFLSAPTVTDSAIRGEITSNVHQSATDCLYASGDSGIVLATSSRILAWQGDGNLVLYKATGGAVGGSSTGGGDGYRFCFQTDGNMCIYNSSGTSIFCTSTADGQQSGNGGRTLSLQGDCNLVIYNSSGKALWAT